MDIQILHIDDEADVRAGVQKQVDGKTVSGHRLHIKDSCDFNEGMQKLANNLYDIVILDLCLGEAQPDSEKAGEVVFAQVKERAFIPVIFFTGLPQYVEDLKSDIVKVIAKAEGYTALLDQIKIVLDAGFLEIRRDVDNMIKDGVKNYFWNFVHLKSAIIAGIKQDDVSLKYLLLRRLGKSLSSELIRSSVNDPQFKKESAHPMEFYIYPPLDCEYEAGDIIRSKENGNLYVTLTPSCDFSVRPNGKRNAEQILLVQAKKFSAYPTFIEMRELEATHKALIDAGKPIPEKEAQKMPSLKGKVKEMMRPGWNERYFFLPPTPFIEATLIDFQHKNTVSYEEMEANYTPVASLDDPIAQAVLTNYARYQSRIGYKDLDIDYALSKIV